MINDWKWTLDKLLHAMSHCSNWEDFHLMVCNLWSSLAREAEGRLNKLTQTYRLPLHRKLWVFRCPSYWNILQHYHISDKSVHHNLKIKRNTPRLVMVQIVAYFERWPRTVISPRSSVQLSPTIVITTPITVFININPMICHIQFYNLKILRISIYDLF